MVMEEVRVEAKVEQSEVIEVKKEVDEKTGWIIFLFIITFVNNI